MKLGRKRKGMEPIVELNITAFLNLMVILVPFLLITAVFSRMTVLELNLPALDAAEQAAQEQNDQDVTLQLQILMRPDAFVIQDARLGPLKTIARLDDTGAKIEDVERKIWKPFRETLLEIKSRFPDIQAVTLLLDSKVAYKDMIAVMDRVGYANVLNAGTLDTVKLFPNISVGDLPEIDTSEVEEGAQP